MKRSREPAIENQIFKKRNSGTFLVAFESNYAFVWDAETNDPLFVCRNKAGLFIQISVSQARNRFFGYCDQENDHRRVIFSFDIDSGKNVSSFIDDSGDVGNFEQHGFDVNDSGTRLISVGSRSIVDPDTGVVLVKMMIPEEMHVIGVYFLKD